MRAEASAAAPAAHHATVCPPTDKTDQRDGERVLRLLMIDGLHAAGPQLRGGGTARARPAREALRGDLMRGRQRLSKLLLRHDVIYEDTASAWTARHRAWLTKLDLGGGAQLTLPDYLHAIDAMVIRRDALQAAIGELVPGSPWGETVARLRCLREIDTLSAVGLCAEVGDLERFDKAGRLMSYLGLVPSENRAAKHAAKARSRRPARRPRQPSAGSTRRRAGPPCCDRRSRNGASCPPARRAS